MGTTANTSPGPKKKVVRVSEEYGLNNIGEKMAELWTHPNKSKRLTLEALKDHFNTSVLRKAIEQAGGDVMAGEAEYLYQNLIDGSTHSEEYDTRERLREYGVDADQVTDDFIKSSQTIHNYLIQVENVEKSEKDNQTRREKSLNHIESLNKRYEAVVKDVIDRLRSDDELPDHEFEVTVDCFVTDMETGESNHIYDLLEE
jgi:nucleotidyltransferase/DNA polymerase involved in DNA repair